MRIEDVALRWDKPLKKTLYHEIWVPHGSHAPVHSPNPLDGISAPRRSPIGSDVTMSGTKDPIVYIVCRSRVRYGGNVPSVFFLVDAGL
jgi:hypothetical protein